MLSIVVLSFCVASSVAEPFYGDYGSELATPTWFRPYGGVTPLLSRAAIIAPVLDTKTQYHFQDVFGTGKYGHSEPTASHHATHDAHGNKEGVFSYLKPDGTIHKTHYIADSDGYRVLSNDLPVGPPTRSLHKRSIAYQYGSTPIITPSGHLADTPDVAAAKAAHFLEHAKRGNYHIASSVAPAATQYSAWSAPTYRHEQHIGTPVASWSTPVGSWPSVVPSGHPTVTQNGYLQETPEVAQAKAAHFAEKLKVSKYWGGDYNSYETTPSQYYNNYAAPYSSSLYSGYAPITPDGQVTDTPEVSEAKAAHFAEHSAALARNAGGHVQQSLVPSYYPQAAYVPSPGVPTDTPEVAQAKAAHFAEYARIANRQKRSIPVGTYPASTLPLPEPILPHHVALPHPALVLPYSFAGSHLSNVVHSPFASSYQVVA